MFSRILHLRDKQDSGEKKLLLLDDNFLNTSLVYADGTPAFHISTPLQTSPEETNEPGSLHHQRKTSTSNPVTTIYRLDGYQTTGHTSKEDAFTFNPGKSLSDVIDSDCAATEDSLSTINSARPFSRANISGPMTFENPIKHSTATPRFLSKSGNGDEQWQDHQVIAAIEWNSWPQEPTVEVDRKRMKLGDFMKRSEDASTPRDRYVIIEGNKKLLWKKNLELYHEKTKIAELHPMRMGLTPSQRRPSYLSIYAPLDDSSLNIVVVSCIITAFQRSQLKQARQDCPSSH